MGGQWHDTLITRAEVAGRIEGWPLSVAVYLSCGKCGQAITQLAGQGGSYATEPGDLASSVLRHMVTAHDQQLGRRDSERDDQRARAENGGDLGPAGGGDSGGGAGDRLADQAAHTRRGAQAGGGDRW